MNMGFIKALGGLASLIFILGLSLPETSLAWSQQSLSQRRVKEIKRLKQRKKAFEAYLKKQEQLKKARLSRVHGQKALRLKYAQRKEKERKNFVRPSRKNLQKAYKSFVLKREKNQKRKEKARQSYSSMEKELKKLLKDQKYRVSGKKEFQL